MASEGYPGSYHNGKVITGLDAAAALPDVTIHHAGTRIVDEGIVTSGGRVLGVTALGDTVAAARDRVHEAIDKIHFEGAYHRRDIVHRAL